MLKPSGRERQKMNPPRIHSTDPAQPMKRAAPSSNLSEVKHKLGFVVLPPAPTPRKNVPFNIETLTSGQQRGGQRSPL